MIASIVKQDGFLSRKTDDDIWEKGAQEVWMWIKEGNLKNTGADHPHVLKDELVRKKMILDEQRALNGTQGKRESLLPLEKGIDSSGLQGVVRS